MICWSCERAAGDGATCMNCEAIQPPRADVDYFQVLGVPKIYALDETDAEERFRELSRKFHPDRFATADPRARRVSLQRSVQLNEAWKTLRDPVRRAEYLLRLSGYEVGAEDGASRPAEGSAQSRTSGQPGGSTGPGERVRMPVSPALLGEVLELREELANARAASDDGRVQTMAADIKDRVSAALGRVAALLASDSNGTPTPPTPARLQQASGELIAVRYYQRFLDEVSIHDEDIAARTSGESYA
jgi:molecular chaperone HscB